MGKVRNWLWGLVLIALGVIWGINALGIMDINIFFPGWWALFIIVPCFIDLFRPNNDKTGDLIGIGVGACLMLACLGLLDFEMIWKLVVPVALIVIGVSLILNGMMRKKKFVDAKPIEGEKKEFVAVFNGLKVDFDNMEFKGAKLESVFGGVKCDLRGAKIEDGALIEASAIFGGIDLFVPEDVKVEVGSTSVFGGVSNHHKAKTEAKKTVYIDATSLFGGVEVK